MSKEPSTRRRHFPELEDCDQCRELWESILHYEQIIAEDSQRLADQEKQILDLVAERDKIAADLVKASTAADKTYDQQMINIDNDLRSRHAPSRTPICKS